MHPLTDNIQKWSGEKMILFPSLIDEKLSRLSMIKLFSNTKIPVPRFAIVPSSYLAQDYDRFGGVVTNRTNINSVIENIRKGDKSELNVLVNRYDGERHWQSYQIFLLGKILVIFLYLYLL